MNICHSNSDRFGFYQVGNFKTYSKFEAITLAKNNKIFPVWKFNNEEFSVHNWTTEPNESLEELYRQRAEQIRNRYDYVVLFYSGGADSFNILDTFLRNNIPIDEIAHCWHLKGDKTYNTLFNEEIHRVAIPNTIKIKEQYPHIKHRIIDQTDLTAGVLQGEMKFDWLYHCNSYLSPNGLARSYLREKIKDYQDLINQGKKLCFVWGSDKPRIHYDHAQKKFYFQFQDIVDNIISPRTQQLCRPWEHDELFYWSPDSTKLLIKQSHIIQRYLMTADDNPLFFSGKKLAYSPKLDKYLNQHGLHRLIYPQWDINTFQRPKTKSSVFGDRDQWYFNSPETTTSKYFFLGTEKIEKNYSEPNVFEMNFLNSQNIYNGIKGFSGPQFYLS